MASNYAAFDVIAEAVDGTRTPLAIQAVEVYDVTHGVALAGLTSDANGHISAGTVTPAAGTTIRFSTEMLDGRMGYAEIVTT